MGNVKDQYFKYAENSDQFVGRCLALLPLLKVDLAVLPAFFSESTDFGWVNELIGVQFHALKRVSEFGLLLRMCLASMLYHIEIGC
jgi:hypothetical protein